MKRTILLALPLLLLVAVGCPPSAWIADYGIETAGPARIDDMAVEGAWKVFEYDGGSSFPSGRFENQGVRIDVIFSSSGVDLVIDNRTDEPIGAIWSETEIDGDYQAKLIRRRGGTREELEPPQAPTSIAPGATERIPLIVSPPGEWQPYTGSETEGFWQSERALFDLEIDEAEDADSRQRLANQALGLEVRLHLTLNRGGKRQALVLPARIATATVRPTYY